MGLREHTYIIFFCLLCLLCLQLLQGSSPDGPTEETFLLQRQSCTQSCFCWSHCMTAVRPLAQWTQNPKLISLTESNHKALAVRIWGHTKLKNTMGICIWFFNIGWGVVSYIWSWVKGRSCNMDRLQNNSACGHGECLDNGVVSAIGLCWLTYFLGFWKV